MIYRLLLAALCVVLFSVNADARQRHRVIIADPGCNVIFPCDGVAPSARGEMIAKAVGFGGAQKIYRPRVSQGPRSALSPSFGFASSSLVMQARSYIGTNPTGWRSLWCGRFMAMIAPNAAAKLRNPNMAKDWLALQHTAGNVGDIAVMGRRGGGHVGVVSGFDASGNPIIVSGNAGGRIVREGVYARGRIIAFVSAG